MTQKARGLLVLIVLLGLYLVGTAWSLTRTAEVLIDWVALEALLWCVLPGVLALLMVRGVNRARRILAVLLLLRGVFVFLRARTELAELETGGTLDVAGLWVLYGGYCALAALALLIRRDLRAMTLPAETRR